MILDDEFKTSSSLYNVKCQLNIPNILRCRNPPKVILPSCNLDSGLYEPHLPVNMGRENKEKELLKLEIKRNFRLECFNSFSK